MSEVTRSAEAEAERAVFKLGGSEPQRKQRLRRYPNQETRKFVTALLLTAVTLGNGLLDIFSVMGGPTHPPFLKEIFPIEFIGLSRTLTLLIGFALVISSLNILRRKRRAWAVVIALACGSVVFQLLKGLDYEEALVSCGLVVALLITRKTFSVRSSVPDFSEAVMRLLITAVLALGYGIAGFWFIDERHFGINFHIGDALNSTLRLISFAEDPRLLPHSHYGAWFLTSVRLIAGAAVAYSGFSLFRPVIYRFAIVPNERAHATQIAGLYARTALDYFKLWPDKSFFFSPSQESFIAYRVARDVAIALGDPVGPSHEILPLIRDFREFCQGNGWTLIFHQTLPDFLPAYRSAGMKKLKIGDDAVVDLTNYSLDGKHKREFRYKIRQLEGLGITFRHYQPPVPAALLEQLKEVSDEWLRIPGRRERTFTLGRFDAEYVMSTPVFTATDKSGKVLAFVNHTPLPNLKEASLDLMRRRADAPNGVMEYLLVKVFLWAKERGYWRFNLGMAPMSGFQDREEASHEERAIHLFFQQLTFLFSFRGLKQYKARFATSWEPRYLIYGHVTELPRAALALRAVSEIKGKDNNRDES